MRNAALLLPGLLLGCLASLAPAQEPPAGHTTDPKSVAVSHDGKHVLTGGGTTAILWEAATGKSLQTYKHSADVNNHTAAVHTVSLSGDGKLVLTGSKDGVSILWDAAGGKKLHTLNGPKPVRGVQRIMGELVEVHPETGPVVLSGDGKLVVTASFDDAAILWNAGDGKQLHTLRHKAHVMDVAASHDGKLVATGYADGTVVLWESAGGKALRTLDGRSGAINCLSLSSDGKVLASGSANGKTVLWETASGKQLRTFEGDYQWVSSASLSGDGKRLATVGGFINPPAILWDVDNGERLHAFQSVSRVILSGDGKTVVTYTGSPVDVWDAATGKKRHSLKVSLRR